LIRATHLWLQNLILRHVYKERFSFILSQSVASKFAKSGFKCQKDPKKLFLKKIKKHIKNAEFYAAFKTVEKVAKKFTHKKLLTKM
jgi:hypothetical protein